MHKNLNNDRGTQVQVVLMKLRGIVKSTGQVIETHEVHKHDHAPYNDKTVLVMHIHPHFCGFTLDVLYHACFFLEENEHYYSGNKFLLRTFTGRQD